MKTGESALTPSPVALRAQVLTTARPCAVNSTGDGPSLFWPQSSVSLEVGAVTLLIVITIAECYGILLLMSNSKPDKVIGHLTS